MISGGSHSQPRQGQGVVERAIGEGQKENDSTMEEPLGRSEAGNVEEEKVFCQLKEGGWT